MSLCTNTLSLIIVCGILKHFFTGLSSSHTTAGYVLFLEVMHDLSKKMWSFLDTKYHQEYVMCVFCQQQSYELVLVKVVLEELLQLNSATEKMLKRKTHIQ